MKEESIESLVNLAGDQSLRELLSTAYDEGLEAGKDSIHEKMIDILKEARDEGYQAGQIDGQTVQAIMEVQGRDRFLAGLRPKEAIP